MRLITVCRKLLCMVIIINYQVEGMTDLTFDLSECDSICETGQVLS